MPEHPSRARVVAAFAAVYFIWGSTYLAIRVAIESVPPFVMAGIRFTIAGIVLFVWARSRGAAPPTRRNWIGALVIGLLLLTTGNGAVVWTEQRVPSGLTALLVATVPVWTVIIEWIGAERARPAARTVVGLLVGLAGVGLLVAPGQVAGGSRVDPVGALVLMGGSILLGDRVGVLAARGPPVLTAARDGDGDALWRGGTAGRGPGERRAGGVPAGSGHPPLGARRALPDRLRLADRVQRVRLAASRLDAGPGLDLRLRQSGGGRGPGLGARGEPLSVRTLAAAAVIVAGVVLITSRAPSSR
jgi:Permeases of the drug/metabolite transporter (DMT) superfamily